MVLRLKEFAIDEQTREQHSNNQTTLPFDLYAVTTCCQFHVNHINLNPGAKVSAKRSGDQSRCYDDNDTT